MTAQIRQPIATLGARGAERLLHGHPWVFRSDVATAPRVDAGLVDVRGPGGRKLGTALYSPSSEITIRRLEANPDVVVDAAWWHDRLAHAIARRTSLKDLTTAYRLVHGEGDGLPSLVVDRYADVLVVQLLSAGLETQRTHIVAALQALCHQPGCSHAMIPPCAPAKVSSAQSKSWPAPYLTQSASPSMACTISPRSAPARRPAHSSTSATIVC